MGSYLANQWFLLIERAPWFRYRTMMGWWRQQRRINCVSRQNDFGVILDWPIWTAFRPNVVSYNWIYFIYGPENTHWLRKGKYQCTTDLLFDWSGFGQTRKSVYSFNSTKQLNPNQSNRRSAVQWYFPLRSKWVFSVWAFLPGTLSKRNFEEKKSNGRGGGRGGLI